jgi:hypothetical protein
MTKSYRVVYEEKIFHFLSDHFTSVYQVLGIIFKSNIIQIEVVISKNYYETSNRFNNYYE